MAAGHGKRVLKAWSWLRHEAFAKGLCLWHIPPKGHYFLHILNQEVLEYHFNPRCLSCLGEESLMGIMRKLGRSVPREDCHDNLMFRYILGVAVRWLDRERAAELGTQLVLPGFPL